jgi:hypothetical protein
MHGESGVMGRDLMTAINRRADYHEAVINKNLEQQKIVWPEGKTRAIAMKQARKDKALKNDALIVGHIAWTAKEHGPEHAAHVANWWQLALQDKEYFPPEFRTGPEGQVTRKPGTKPTSMLRENIMKARDIKGKAMKQELYDIGAKRMSQPPKQPEGGRAASGLYRGMRGIVAPFAAAKHLEQFAALGANQPSTSTLWKTYMASFGSGRKEIMDIARANDAMGSFMSDAAADVWRYRNGIFNQKWIPPEIGQKLSKYAGSMPLLRAVRERLVPMAAAKGYFTTTHEIERLLKDPKNQEAKLNLSYMGFKEHQQADLIDRYRANGMKLHPEDARTAINTSVEQYAFTTNPLWRSRFGLHPVTRFLTPYHWAAQGTKGMVLRDMKHAMKMRNPVQLASTIAAYSARAGVIYSVGKVLNIMRGVMVPQTQSPEDDAKRFSMNMHMFAEMVGWGQEWGVVNAAAHRHLADSTYGAHIGNAIRATEDLTYGTTMYLAGRENALKPFARDMLEEIPWYLGDHLAHSWFPTQAEKQAARPMTADRLRAQRGAQTRKLKKKYLGE